MCHRQGLGKFGVRAVPPARHEAIRGSGGSD